MTYDKRSPTSKRRVVWRRTDTPIQQVGCRCPGKDTYSSKRTDWDNSNYTQTVLCLAHTGGRWVKKEGPHRSTMTVTFRDFQFPMRLRTPVTTLTLSSFLPLPNTRLKHISVTPCKNGEVQWYFNNSGVTLSGQSRKLLWLEGRDGIPTGPKGLQKKLLDDSQISTKGHVTFIVYTR